MAIKNMGIGKKNIKAMTIKNMGIGKEHMGAVANFSPTTTILIPEWILSTIVIVSSSLLLLVELAMYVVDDHNIESILLAIIVFFTILSSYTFVYKLVRVHAAGTISLADVLSLFAAVGMTVVCTLEYLRVVVRMTWIKFRGFDNLTIMLAMVVFFLAVEGSRLRNKAN